ncbi:MAG: aminotransferase class IV [Planctomycetota bacterium]|nr:aminotransferase class IV [Planctomycetota bacterium]
MKVFLNGDLVAPHEAKISVFDRGFLFGDGVYEVVRSFEGQPLDLELHTGRLKKSLTAIHMDSIHANALSTAYAALAASHGLANWSLYFQITRGADTDRVHMPRPNLAPTVFACAAQTDSLALLRSQAMPDVCEASTAIDQRWLRLEIKSISLLGALLPLLAARESGSSEVILMRDGRVAEGGSSNCFMFADGALVTPPLGDPPILHGCMRTLVLETAVALGIPVRVRQIHADELNRTSDLFFTGSRSIMRSVSILDGRVLTPRSNELIGHMWSGLVAAIGSKCAVQPLTA